MEGRSIMSCKDQKLRGSLTLRQLKIYQPESRWLATPMYWLIIAPDFLPPNLGAAIAIYFHNRCIPFQKEAKDWNRGHYMTPVGPPPNHPIFRCELTRVLGAFGIPFAGVAWRDGQKISWNGPKKKRWTKSENPNGFLEKSRQIPQKLFFLRFLFHFFCWNQEVSYFLRPTGRRGWFGSEKQVELGAGRLIHSSRWYWKFGKTIQHVSSTS